MTSTVCLITAALAVVSLSRRIDIGLMPMPDTPWTRGKAATKALQYRACGAPTVASRTATNLAILGESEGTLFATTSDEWTASLLRLIDDAALRSTLGRQAHARVLERFSVESNAPRLIQLIREPAATLPS